MLYSSLTLANFQKKLVIGPDVVPKPSEEFVRSAARAVAHILLQEVAIHPTIQGVSRSGQAVYRADKIIDILTDGGNHTRPASAWAILDLIQDGLLEAELFEDIHPIIRFDRSFGRGPLAYDLPSLCPPTAQHIVGPTESGEYIAGPTRTGAYILGPKPFGDHLVVPQPEGSRIGGLRDLALHDFIDLGQTYLGIWPTQYLATWFNTPASGATRDTEPPTQASPHEGGPIAPSLRAAISGSSGSLGAALSEKPPRTKRSTTKGQARALILAAMAKHHGYDKDEETVKNRSPIGNNELARECGQEEDGRPKISKGSVSEFFKKEFGDHTAYQRACSSSKIGAKLKAIFEEYVPSGTHTGVQQDAPDARQDRLDRADE